MFGAVAVFLVAVVVQPVAARHNFPQSGRHQLNSRRVIPVGACRSLPAQAHARGDVDGCGGGCRFLAVVGRLIKSLSNNNLGVDKGS